MEFTQLNNAPDNLIDRIGISHQDHSESSLSDHGDFGIWPSSAPPEPKDICAELCREYTRLITEYWRVCRVNSELDSKHYLDIIDLCPGSGLSCWLMMKSLGRHIGTEFRYRYIPLVPDRSWLSDLLTIPEFSDWIQNGSLAPLVWDCSQADPRFFGNADEKIWRPCNPLVVISHDRFCYLRHRLLAVHYGRLFEAQFVDSTDEYHFVSEQPEKYDTKKQNESVKWNHLDRTQEEIGSGIKFNKYLEKFNSSPLPLPLGAVQFIKKIHQLAHRGYLLVSLGNGMNTEQDLRLASFQYLIEKVQKKETLPINFHMIEQLFHDFGVHNISKKMQGNRVLHLAIASPGSHAQESFRKVFMMLDEASLFHNEALIEATRSLGSASALSIRGALLELSDFDPSVFSAGHASLTVALAGASQSGSLDKHLWKHILEQVWSRYLPTNDADQLHQYLAPAAMHCGAWGLAKRALIRGMDCFGESAFDLANLAWCESRTGNADAAQALVNQALQLDPECVLANEVRRRVDERLSSRNDRWRCVLRDADTGLVLEPLDSSHADALCYQYRDPQIAIMTGLPQMKSREEMLQWINEQGNDDKKINYAIILPDEGLAGFINLAVSEHAAFFCFWSGVDFQGRGLAGIAGAVACQHAIRSGVPIILTSAFSDNYRSIKSLKRMGFIEIPIRAMPPDHDRIFFILDNQESFDASQSIRELVDYYSRENLSLCFPSSEDIVGSESSAAKLKTVKES